MARNGLLLRRKRMEDFDELSSFSGSPEVHVLAVDDSLVDRTVIERLLRITSCKVTSVDSGTRALQFLGLDEQNSSAGFDGLKVDLIITDYCMPGMTGYELLKKIKGSSTFRETPVVIMSSENVVSRIDRCLEEGAEGFIVKPVKLSDVKRLKSNVFGENQINGEDGRITKRNFQEMTDLSTSSSSTLQPLLSDVASLVSPLSEFPSSLPSQEALNLSLPTPIPAISAPHPSSSLPLLHSLLPFSHSPGFYN